MMISQFSNKANGNIIILWPRYWFNIVLLGYRPFHALIFPFQLPAAPANAELADKSGSPSFTWRSLLSVSTRSALPLFSPPHRNREQLKFTLGFCRSHHIRPAYWKFYMLLVSCCSVMLSRSLSPCLLGELLRNSLISFQRQPWEVTTQRMPYLWPKHLPGDECAVQHLKSRQKPPPVSKYSCTNHDVAFQTVWHHMKYPTVMHIRLLHI